MSGESTAMYGFQNPFTEEETTTLKAQAAGGGTGGGGATNLSATASPTGVDVESDTGTNATLPLVDDTNAGLMDPADKVKLNTAPEDIAAAIQAAANGQDPTDPPKTHIVEIDGSIQDQDGEAYAFTIEDAAFAILFGILTSGGISMLGCTLEIVENANTPIEIVSHDNRWLGGVDQDLRPFWFQAPQKTFPADVHIFPIDGQSNSNGTDAEVQPAYSVVNHLMFIAGVFQMDGIEDYGGIGTLRENLAATPDAQYDGNGNIIDNGSGETSASAMGQRLTQEFGSNYTGFFFAHGRGGQRLEQLAKGSRWYQRYIEGLYHAKHLFAMREQTVDIGAHPWIQGEANYSYPEKQTAEAYAEELIAHYRNKNADAKRILGLTDDAPMLVAQVSAHQNFRDPSGTNPQNVGATMQIAQGQWIASKREPNIYLTQVMYDKTYDVSGIHVTGASQRAIGDKNAEAFAAIKQTGTWEPLQPDSIAVTGSGPTWTTTITLNRSAVVDATIAADQADLGFRFYAADNLAYQDIITASTVSGNTITLTTNADPTGLILNHGRGTPSNPAIAGTQDGTTWGCGGPIRDVDNNFLILFYWSIGEPAPWATA